MRTSSKVRVIWTHNHVHPIGPRKQQSSLELDFDVDAGSQIELHKSINRLRCWIDNIEQPFVRANFELLAALLVNVW